MKIGILETGEVNEKIVGQHGTYPQMFERLLGTSDPDLTFHTWSVVNGEIPAAPQDADGWVVTGSRHGVYDDLPWIEPLKDFLRECLLEKVPVAGICFGHQILAEAMGGKAEKSDKGWGLGVHDYVVKHSPSWMKDFTGSYRGHAVHQDQVTVQPPESVVLASSDFCEYAALAYGDAEAPLAISVQSHPEFSPGYMVDLIEARMRGVVPDEVADQSKASISDELNNANWAHWIVTFLRQAAARA
jgi:GMP synthase-like glutamine amidotransferase